MELSEYKQKFKIVKTNEEKELATEIWNFFGKNISYPFLLKLINEKGKYFVRNTFIEIKKSDFAHRKELFLKLVLNQKISTGQQ